MWSATRALAVTAGIGSFVQCFAACSEPSGSATNERDASGVAGKGGAMNDDGSSGWGDASSDSAAGGSKPDGGGAAGTSAGGASGGGGTGGAPACPTIHVKSAIYAANCGAPTNVSSVAATCEGLQQCSYTMDYTKDPGFDPALYCAKDMTVEYDCVQGTTVVASKSAYAAAEAGVGSVLTLVCDC